MKNVEHSSSASIKKCLIPSEPANEAVVVGGARFTEAPVAVLDATWKPLLDPLDTKSPVARTALTAAQPEDVVGAVELNVVPSVEYESVHPAG